MKVFTAKCILGVFAFDEKGKPVDSVPFSGGAGAMAERYRSDADEAGLARRLAGKGFDVVTSAKVEGFEHQPDNLARSILSRDMMDVAVQMGHYGSKAEAAKAVRDVGLALAEKDLAGRKPGKDTQAAQAVRTLDELNRVIERLGQRTREWFLAMYPDRSGQMPGPESIEDRDDPRYHSIVVELHKKNLEVIERAIRSEISDDPTLGAIKALAEDLIQLYKERDILERYISETMAKAAPTLAEIAGPAIAARLVSEAGSLRRLAMMSSTTVQLLGARKAVFRHIRHGGKPPKHGLLFVHPAVGGSRGHQRGKAAKALAAIVVRAARVDAFGTGDPATKAKALKKELEKTMARIRAIPQTEKASRPPKDEGKERPKKPGSRQRRRQNAVRSRK